VYITSQNHGYAVEAESLPSSASVNYINVNDGTCEGVCYELQKAFSVQFDPNACTGAKAKGFLFDEFLNMLGGDE
ncbi:MAG: carbamoyl phosphate synthase small subunit, partial [Firmicutes bacterium]|nr:carbamoyl phosphate synthase small subunit [Bacillota bacterium]